ncbi:hypothetical protein ABZW18_25260 [Streptomyces sp. NPDC004647]|uniref:hypothetical protein n=1 Tax=Streptomyces sp. NPDC004647 TaxID=3154671 RepID=UPI0033A97491
MCDNQQGYYYDRFSACTNVEVDYKVIDTRTGKVVGDADFTAIQDIKLGAKDDQWHSEVSLRLDSATGHARGLKAVWKTRCKTASACGSDDAWSVGPAHGRRHRR